jgi:hypothetical protein
MSSHLQPTITTKTPPSPNPADQPPSQQRSHASPLRAQHLHSDPRCPRPPTSTLSRTTPPRPTGLLLLLVLLPASDQSTPSGTDPALALASRTRRPRAVPPDPIIVVIPTRTNPTPTSTSTAAARAATHHHRLLYSYPGNSNSNNTHSTFAGSATHKRRVSDRLPPAHPRRVARRRQQR